MTAHDLAGVRRPALYRVALAGAVLVGGACGTRVDLAGARIDPGEEAAAIQAPSSFEGAPAAEASPGVGVAVGTTKASAPGNRQTGANAIPVEGKGRVDSAPSGSSGAVCSGECPTGKKAPSGTPPRKGEPTPSAVGGGTPAPAVPRETVVRSPVKVGSVGTYSGPVGGVMVPVLRGAQVWVKYINNKGGLNGHPVHLSVYDDGGDPARHRAATQQAVEADHVMAFLANGEPVTGASKVEYLNAKRVPVVGVAGGETWAYSSPMYFPQAPTGQAIVETFALGSGRYAVPRGKTRFGTLTCAEVPDCPKLEQAFAKHEKSSGYQYVYKGRASLAQPDFTAECLAARNAGVELLSLLMDSGSQNRIGVSCARQGYFPMYQIPAAAVRDEIKGNPNFDGALAILSTFPYFQSGTPATDEYQEAMRSFGQGALLGPGMAVGWVAGKLFEKAAGDLPEPPTTAALLAGLWRIHGDTLGGLTYPLNFIENQPPKLVACWFNMVVQKSKWVSPDEYRLNCE